MMIMMLLNFLPFAIQWNSEDEFFWSKPHVYIYGVFNFFSLLNWFANFGLLASIGVIYQDKFHSKNILFQMIDREHTNGLSQEPCMPVIA
jgi:hypothetical protein